MPLASSLDGNLSKILANLLDPLLLSEFSAMNLPQIVNLYVEFSKFIQIFCRQYLVFFIVLTEVFSSILLDSSNSCFETFNQLDSVCKASLLSHEYARCSSDINKVKTEVAPCMFEHDCS